jgi:uncharacterized membrane protein YidH (DUF202 family)
VAPAEDMEDIDPGFARERTELAWTRTAISFAALGGAMLKTTPLAGALVLAASAIVWGIGRLARSSGRAGPGSRDEPRLLLLITLVVTAVSLASLALAFLGGRAPGLR